jgi:putative methionine-R-sulfoxide reductase with GAF domain
MRQFRFSEIVLAVEDMVKTCIITDEELGACVLEHIRNYMDSKRAATVRLTTACALLLEALQTYDWPPVAMD